MNLVTIILYVFVAIGLFFNIVGILGLLRFPDVYTRLHAETKTTTFGSIFIALAITLFGFVHYHQSQDPAMLSLSIHALIAIVVLGFTNATGSHAIAHAAYSRGQRPQPAVVDHLAEKQPSLKKEEA